MELAKKSVLRLTLLASASAVVCLSAIGLLGYSLKSYWEFDANRDAEAERLEKMREEVREQETALAEKRHDVSQVENLWREFSQLTNDLERTRSESRAAVSEQKVVMEAISKLKDDRAAIESALSASNAVKVSVQNDLSRLRGEIDEARKMKEKLAGVDKELAEKDTELGGVTAELKRKHDSLSVLETKIAAVQNSMVTANSNLVSATERAESEERALRLRKETLAKLEAEIMSLEVKKSETAKEVDSVALKLKQQDAQMESLRDRLSDLAVQYIAETNKLSGVRRAAQKAADDSRAEVEAECRRKTQAADAQLKKAQETVAAAEKKAAELIAAAKSSVAAIEKTAQTDKEESEKACAEKVEAGLATSRAKRELAEAEAAKSLAESDKAKIEAECKALQASKGKSETELAQQNALLATAQEKVRAKQAEVDRLSASIKELRETEEELARAIASRREVLKSLTSTKMIEETKEKKN